MRYTAAAATAAGAVALATGATAQNVVSFELTRGIPGIRGGPLPSAPLSKRDFHAGSINNNITGGGYYVDVQVGTPGQAMSMVLDTGSSDAWFINYQADLCTNKNLQRHYGDSCGPTFNPSQSSTYAMKIRDGFNITYIDGTGATGSYVTDNLQINGVTVKSLQMGMATHVVRGVGILGVGFSQNVAATVKYPNIIDTLADQGLINSKAFSLYLNDRSAKTGTLLFGGVDKSKFIGPLHTLPIPKQPNGYTYYGVAMSSLSTTYSNGTKVPISSTLAGAILDSGSTLTYLPDELAAPLFAELGVYTDYQTSGYSMIDCGLLDSEPDLVVSFGFGTGQASGGTDQFTISVPVTELVLDLLSGYGSLTAGAPFENVCLFGIQSSGGGFGGSAGSNETADVTILGDSFLRSAYVVYDQDHHQIGLAQANVNASGDSDIQELTSAGTALPSVTGVSAQQASSATKSSGSSKTTTTNTRGTGTNGPSGSATGGGAQNTGTASPSPSGNAASSVRGGGADAFVVAVVAGLFSVLGGALFMS